MTNPIRAHDLTVLLPARDEAKAIGKVIDEIKNTTECKILVMDGLSEDGTPTIALRKGASVLYEFRKGKGIAVRSALRFIDTPYVIMMNADFTYPAEYLSTIYHILSRSKADVVQGFRNLKEEGSMSLKHSFGNWGLSLLASILYGKRVYDVCSGMWGFKTDILKEFDIVSEGFTLEADLFVNAVKKGCRMEQIPIVYRKRLSGGKSKLTIWDGFKIAWFLIKRRFTK